MRLRAATDADGPVAWAIEREALRALVTETWGAGLGTAVMRARDALRVRMTLSP